MLHVVVATYCHSMLDDSTGRGGMSSMDVLICWWPYQENREQSRHDTVALQLQPQTYIGLW